MIELLYKKPGSVELQSRPWKMGRPSVIELGVCTNVTNGNFPRLQHTLPRLKGKYPKGSNERTESVWTHFNHELMSRIRAIRNNDIENNLRAV